MSGACQSFERFTCLHRQQHEAADQIKKNVAHLWKLIQYRATKIVRLLTAAGQGTEQLDLVIAEVTADPVDAKLIYHDAYFSPIDAVQVYHPQRHSWRWRVAVRRSMQRLGKVAIDLKGPKARSRAILNQSGPAVHKMANCISANETSWQQQSECI